MSRYWSVPGPIRPIGVANVAPVKSAALAAAIYSTELLSDFIFHPTDGEMYRNLAKRRLLPNAMSIDVALLKDSW